MFQFDDVIMLVRVTFRPFDNIILFGTYKKSMVPNELTMQIVRTVCAWEERIKFYFVFLFIALKYLSLSPCGVLCNIKDYLPLPSGFCLLNTMTYWHGNSFRITGFFVRGIHRWPVDSLHKGSIMGSFSFFLFLFAWSIGWIICRWMTRQDTHVTSRKCDMEDLLLLADSS